VAMIRLALLLDRSCNLLILNFGYLTFYIGANVVRLVGILELETVEECMKPLNGTSNGGTGKKLNQAY
jgi:hypothetical protein